MPATSSRRRRFKPSHVYSVVSLAVVLFMLGLLGILFSTGRELANQFKEQVEFTLILKDPVKEDDVLALQKSLLEQPWVKSADYVSKEKAAEIYSKDSGEDFAELLEYNPLFASINITLPAHYTSQDSINSIEKRILVNAAVGEFYYDRMLVEILNDNFRKIGWVVIAIGTLFLIIAITLIDSTIRLSMYASRFLIRSMQLVGATRVFITRPFVRRSLANGIIAACIAAAVLFLLLRSSMNQLPELHAVAGWEIQAGAFFLMLVAGLLFSFLSTHYAVRKYLRMKIDELY